MAFQKVIFHTKEKLIKQHVRNPHQWSSFTLLYKSLLPLLYVQPNGNASKLFRLGLKVLKTFPLNSSPKPPFKFLTVDHQLPLNPPKTLANPYNIRMDAAKIKKIQAMNRYRNYQLLNNLLFYTVTALTCSLLCSSPFWLVSQSSSMRVFPSVSLPKLGSLLFSSMSVFVVGSLIIIFLVGESKALTSESPPVSEVYYDEYVSVSRSLWSLSDHEEKREMTVEKCFEEKVKRYEDGEGGKWKIWEMEKKPKVKLGGEENLSLPELNKRADDFIARINRQRRLEANY